MDLRLRYNVQRGAFISNLRFREAPIIVLKPFNIVFSQIAAGLNLNEFQGYFAGVFQAMPRATGDVCALVSHAAGIPHLPWLHGQFP